MSVDFSMKLVGWQEVNAALKQLPDRVAKKVLRTGVREGAKPLRKAMRAAAPIRKEPGWKRIKAKGAYYRGPGFLKARLGYKYLRKRSSRMEVHYGVGPFGWAYYGFIVARGHIIGKRQRLKGKRGKRTSGVGSVPPHDFMTPVFYSQRGRAIDAMAKGFEKGILKEAKKLGINTQAFGSIPFSAA